MSSASESIAQGRAARKEGNFPLARQCYAEAASIYRGQNDPLAYAHTIRHMADIFQQEGNLVEAKSLYEESLELYRSNLDTKLLDLANTVRPPALLNKTLGHVELALSLWEEARNLYGSLQIAADVAECEGHISKLQKY